MNLEDPEHERWLVSRRSFLGWTAALGAVLLTRPVLVAARDDSGLIGAIFRSMNNSGNSGNGYVVSDGGFWVPTEFSRQLLDGLRNSKADRLRIYTKPGLS